MIFIVAVLAAGAALVFCVWTAYRQENNVGGKNNGLAVTTTVHDFVDCLKDPSGVVSEYQPDSPSGGLPRKCFLPSGRMFIEDLGNTKEKAGFVHLTNLMPNQWIKSPLVITGEAISCWFFEASFPVELVAADGQVLAKGTAQALEDWMKAEGLVKFRVQLAFDRPKTDRGELIFRKDNPSGLPENDDALRLPILFSPAGK